MIKVELGFFLDMKVGDEKRRYSCDKVICLSREPVIGEGVQVFVKLPDGSSKPYLVTIKSASMLIENYEFSRYTVVVSKELKDYLLNHLMGDTGWQINHT